ncbi:(d)CMP kinase [Borrelia hermsii]|uniref:Cytidylate kinase n=3 Tax=Borrelia hermsii TaxID=140 RepID=A0AAN0X524_BORHE|nr:AAA family ATPase [Borrelia hermsii]AAX17315.1 cytidylate kinase [Borrelia hermsii DAH]AHH12851.1 Cytidylate kinase [Borrelia hermsii YBT]AJW73593.1 cytidylate kinase [Borrelia hermsii CC1]AMR75052.1 Cytidylate kinase [Borrelia hermsii]ANA43618.1 cytidylate kinase [Borrelia hermsii HS1]
MRIAVSGKSGCGNTTISGMLAKYYGLKLVNYTFHDIAREKNMPFDMFYEKEIIGRNDHYWDEYLDGKLLELSKEDNTVLASRLAIWLSKNADLKIYLYAKIEIRAERIINREGGMYSDILRSTFNRDSNDSKRYLSVYNIDIDNYLDVADFIVDTTDRSANKVFELIKDEIEKRKLYIK